MFQKSPRMQPSFKKLKSTQAQMALFFYQYALKLQRLENILPQTAAPKVPEWPSYGNFGKVTQKPHFLKKCKEGRKEIFQKSSKKMPSLKRPKSTLAQIALSSNQYALKVQRLEKIQAQTAAQKLPKQRSYGNFRKGTQNLHFLKKCKGETKRSF